MALALAQNPLECRQARPHARAIRLVLVTAFAVFFAGCGKPTPAEQCQKLAQSVCDKKVSCDKTVSKADCQAAEQLTLDCANAASCGFPENLANGCFNDLSNASCSGGTPASCALNRLCPVQTKCTGIGVSAGASGCTVTLTGDRGGACSDGHTYGAHCASPGNCDCQKDGALSGDSFSTSSDLCQQADQLSSLKAGCGWDF